MTNSFMEKSSHAPWWELGTAPYVSNLNQQYRGMGFDWIK